MWHHQHLERLGPWGVVVFAIACLRVVGCRTVEGERIVTLDVAPAAQEVGGPHEGAPVPSIEVREEKYDDGTVKTRIEGYMDADGNFVRHGLLTNFWENGAKKSQVTYFHGLRHGPRTAWYQNGQMWSQGEFVNDRSDGVWTTWYPNGQKAQEYHFDHGAWHGMLTEWHPNGKKKKQVEYVHGKKQGPLFLWDEQGRLVRQIDYVNDVAQP